VGTGEWVSWIDTGLDAALGRIDAFVNKRLGHDTEPGIALALTTRDQLLGVATAGLADAAGGAALRASHLFEFGSIGKSFTAVALLQLREEGRLDLDAPVTDYLPWFAVQSDYPPIATHHLLSHTSGLTGGTDFAPDPRYEVWAARDLHVAHAPGEAFHYSNLGYKALGLLLERLEGKPYAEIVRERLLDPLGMRDTMAVIANANRPRLATGHVYRDTDRPHRPGDPLAPASWLETNTGDGCIVSTAADLTAWLRMLLNRGSGSAGRILSEESFALLTRPVIEMSPGSGRWYGYGLMTFEQDGQRLLGHTGGMVGYVSAMFGDVERGVGAVVMVNGPGAPLRIATDAVAVLAAAHDGRDLPSLPDEPDPDAVPDAEQFAGVYRSGDRAWEIVVSGDRLSLVADGQRAPLLPLGPAAFRAEDPALAHVWVRAQVEDGRAVALTHGGDVFHREGLDAPETAALPEEWRAYPGHYRSHNPWASDFRVVSREGRFFLLFPEPPDGFEGDQPLDPLPDGSFAIRSGDYAYDRIRFDTVVDGEALRANLSGADYYRFFTP